MFIAKAYLHLSYRLVEHIPQTEQSSKEDEISHSSESDSSSPVSSDNDENVQLEGKISHSSESDSSSDISSDHNENVQLEGKISHSSESDGSSPISSDNDENVQLEGKISHSSESDGSSPISSEEDKKTRTHNRYLSKLYHELRLLALKKRDTNKLLKTCTTVKGLLSKLKKSNLLGRNTLKRNGKLETTIDNIPVTLINFPGKKNSSKTYALLGNPETSLLGEGFSKKVYVGFDIKKKERVVLSFLKYQDESEIKKGKQEVRITEYLKSNNVPLVGKILHCKVITEGDKKRLCVVQKPYFGGTLENKLDTLTSAQKYRIAYHLLDMIQQMHKLNIVYLDWHLDNILLDKEKRPVITDFGNSRDLTAVGNGPKSTQSEMKADIAAFAGMLLDLLKKPPQGLIQQINELKKNRSTDSLIKLKRILKHLKKKKKAPQKWDIDSVYKNQKLFKDMLKWAKKTLRDETLLFIQDVKKLNTITKDEDIKEKGMLIYNKYLKSSATKEVNINSNDRNLAETLLDPKIDASRFKSTLKAICGHLEKGSDPTWGDIVKNYKNLT